MKWVSVINKESIFNVDQKTYTFKDNPLLNQLINEMKSLLEPVQASIQDKFDAPKWPVGLVIGCSRSGTTLLLQWLASLTVFSYPTNFLSRFAYAPYLGALIQKMVFDSNYDINSQFADVNSEINFESDYGKSMGALASNEFNHFFRNYMPNVEPMCLDESQLKKINTHKMQKGFASIEEAFGLPFVTKGVFIKYNMSYFYKNIPKLFFLVIKRRPLFTMQSLLIAREKNFGNIKYWFGNKPPGYESLLKMDVYHQVAGQVYFTEQTIDNELQKIPEDHKSIISYEDFCKAPESLYIQLVKKYNELGCKISASYLGPESFVMRNKARLSDKEIYKLENAMNYFYGNTGN